MATTDDKVRADNGPAAAGTEVRPLVEPLSYAGSVENVLAETSRPGQWRWRTRKWTELDRPYCQTLLCEIYNDEYSFEWHRGIVHGWNDPEGPPGDGTEPWRHYGGSNWLFADGHVAWHAVASLAPLFCCQDFGPGELEDELDEVQRIACTSSTHDDGRQKFAD